MQIYSYSDIKEIAQDGIYMKNGICIYFDECISNSRKYLNNETSTCVAERDITANPPYFAFYTEIGEIIQFNAHKGLFAKKKNYYEFRQLQLLLQKMGFTTYDLS